MTSDWDDWDVVRRQVAVCGRLSADLVDRVEVRVEGKQRATTATVRHDGIYFCLDLPSGQYRVAAANPHGEVFGAGTANVSRNGEGDITYAVVDIESPSPAAPRPPPPRLRKGRHSP